MVIRKVSIGNNLTSAMNYIVGQSVINDSHVIHEISVSNTYISIYIINDKYEMVKWKDIRTTTPHTIEYNINI